MQYDKETKLPLYAEARINNYWIVNLVDNRLEVYTNPLSDCKSKFDYRNKSIILPNEHLKIPTFDNLILELRTVFRKTEI